MPADPSIGRVVWYRSKVGAYDVPALITATQDTLSPEGVALYMRTRRADLQRGDVDLDAQGVPPLSGPDRVHLTVCSPGLPGNPARAGLDLNAGGTYREWDVPLFEPSMRVSAHPAVGPQVPPEPEPGTWRWPVIR
jgi:hypothetical protein